MPARFANGDALLERTMQTAYDRLVIDYASRNHGALPAGLVPLRIITVGPNHASQITGILKQAELCTPIAELCRQHGVSEQRFLRHLVPEDRTFA